MRETQKELIKELIIFLIFIIGILALAALSVLGIIPRNKTAPTAFYQTCDGVKYECDELKIENGEQLCIIKLPKL